ncbi:glycosyltransferase family 2 protein [Spirillospora sp. NPDC048911]|uniref:glycosyltransferase family 2 protein n=1 Tax=Spirillospora sp. NPDC048911 TaxID=3364527 RepID=UPI0037235AB5
MTTLSVIVPARNVQGYAGDMLRGLAANARDDFEYIVVDDGSTDRTPEILAAAAERVPRLTVVRHDQAKGLSGARNAGLAVSTGRYISYLDGDDWVVPGYFADLVEAIDGLGCDFVRVDHIQVFGRRRVVERAPAPRRGVVLKPREAILPAHDKTMVDYPYAWAGVFRRELADAGMLAFDEPLLTAEDRPWIWRLHRLAGSYAVVSLAGVHYRREVAGSLTQVGDARQLHFFDSFDMVLAELADDPDRVPFVRKAVRTYLAVIAHHLSERERLTPVLRRQLRARARTTIKGMPPEVLAEVLPGLGGERTRLFTQQLGTDVIL